MPSCMILKKQEDQDLGLYKFTFKFRDKAYTVLPKDTDGYNRINEYFKYVAGVCKKSGLNPFMYKSKGRSATDLFEIRPAGTGDRAKEKYDFSELKKKLEESSSNPGNKVKKSPIPVNQLTKHLKKPGPERVEQMSLFASHTNLTNRVLLKYANWESNNSNLFWDEITNQEIDKEKVRRILETFTKGSDTEFSVSKVTGIDSYTCKKVLDLAENFNLLS